MHSAGNHSGEGSTASEPPFHRTADYRDRVGVSTLDLRVTICVLCYGDYPELARQCIRSIMANCRRERYQLVVGANVPSLETERFLRSHRQVGAIDQLLISRTNLHKSPMMRRLFAQVTTELIWWFDDDSYIIEGATLERWLQVVGRSPPSVVCWGHPFFFRREEDFAAPEEASSFVRSASWYRGLAPPLPQLGTELGDAPELANTSASQWHFITGGCWMIRTGAVAALDWPDPRLEQRADDIYLSEAIRQQCWGYKEVKPLGVVINSRPGRGRG